MSIPGRVPAFDLLTGKGAYAPVSTILEGLRTEHIGELPAGFKHSLFQQLWHIVYWQEHEVAKLKGAPVRDPEHAAESWPADPAPERPQVWEELLERFLQGASSLDVLAAAADGGTADGTAIRYAVAQIAVHTAYHAGQMVLLRQVLGLWPPPAGGDTW